MLSINSSRYPYLTCGFRIKCGMTIAMQSECESCFDFTQFPIVSHRTTVRSFAPLRMTILRLLRPSDVEYLSDGDDVIVQVIETFDLVHRNVILSGDGI